MDRLAAMTLFMRVAETGSFSEVGREFGLTQPTVSKQVAALERSLGARLLARSTRSVALTEDGGRYYERCRAVAEAVEQAEASIGQAAAPAGMLRVSCPVSFGQVQLAPRIPALLSRYPRLQVDLNMSDLFVDLVEAGADVAIRIGELGESALVARRIGLTRRLTVAAPGYLHRASEPSTPADLSDHDCIVFTRLASVDRWRFIGPGGEHTVKVAGGLRASNALAVREAVIAGAGIAVLPAWLISDALASGALVAIMPDYQPKPLPMHLLFPTARPHPLRVRAFADFVLDAFRDEPWLAATPAATLQPG